MRPIPAPRIGESHGLLRAINQRERLRLDEFVTEFSAEDLFPPGLENAFGRTRQFVSFARAAGLLKEDRGVVELTEIGKRYVRAGDESDVFSVSPSQADWLRRQLLEKHMTDSIYHGLAIGLSLLSSIAPGVRISTLDFGRALGYLGRAGWDNDNTLQIQGERYLDLLRDVELIDAERALTVPIGHETKSELTLPVHMSLPDLAAQLNPGGADAVKTDGEAEWAKLTAPPEPPAAAEATPAAPAPAAEEEDEWQDVVPGQPAAAAVPQEPAPPPPAPVAPAAATPTPAPTPAEAPPTPPADIWETAEPYETTSAYAAVRPPEPAPPEEPEPPPAPPEPADPLERPQDAPTVVTTPDPPEPTPAPPPVAQPPQAPPPAAPPRLAEAPPPAPRAASGFLDAAAVRSAAEAQGLRLPGGVYANVVAALAAGKHVVITGAPGSGKTTLALAIAQAAATSGRSSGAVLVTAGDGWTIDDTLGGQGDGHVIDAASRGKWLVIDELDRADVDRALGALSSFLSGLPVTLPTGDEATPPEDWRIVATTGSGSLDASAALWRRFAHVELPAPDDGALEAVIDAAAGGDPAAAGAARRLLVLRELKSIGAGVFADAAGHAAERNAIEPADERTLARDAYNAYFEGLLVGLDDREQVRLRELLGGL